MNPIFVALLIHSVLEVTSRLSRDFNYSKRCTTVEFQSAMAPPSLSVEKRLEAKRAVRRMAKVVRSSIRSSLRNGGGQELWQNLEK